MLDLNISYGSMGRLHKIETLEHCHNSEIKNPISKHNSKKYAR